MLKMRLAVWDQTRATLYGYLHNPIDWAVAFPLNDTSSLKFSYSSAAPDAIFDPLSGYNYNIADNLVSGPVLSGEVTPRLILEMQFMWPDGTWYTPPGALFSALDQEWEVGSGETVHTFTCAGVEYLFDNYSPLSLYSDTSYTRAIASTATTGRVAADIFDRIKESGAPSWMVRSYGVTTDSAGATWVTTLPYVAPVTTTYGAVARDLVDWGLIDWRMQGWTMQAYIQNTAMQRDYGPTGGNSKFLLPGRDITVLRAKKTRRTGATFIGIFNSDKPVQPPGVRSYTSSTGIGGFNGNLVTVEPMGNTTGTLPFSNYHNLLKLGVPEFSTEYTVDLLMTPSTVVDSVTIPFRDYLPGDRLTSVHANPTNDGAWDDYKVSQITLTGDGMSVTGGSLILGDRKQIAALARQRQARLTQARRKAI